MANATILYWNIENFTLNKITDANPPPDADFDYDGEGQGPERLEFIMDMIAGGLRANGAALIPDFIVIVEVERGTTNNRMGYYVNQNPRTALLQLHGAITERLDDGTNDWQMVPPIVLGRGGKGEGIAVFYNSYKWYFLGPDRANGLYSYPQEYDGSLRNRVIPGNYGIQINRGQREDRLRGQWQFKQDNMYIRFPGRRDRVPWLTYFGSINAPYTLVRLLGFHSSPNNATQGVPQIARIRKMMNNQIEGNAQRQIDVLVGDFNVDNFDDDNFESGPYANFVDGNFAQNPANPPYTALIRPPANIDGVYNGYFQTEAKPLHSCLIEFGDAPIGRYPGYSYLKASIDNAFVRHLGFGGPIPPPNMTIINRAVQTPFAWPPAPPPAPPHPLPQPYPPAGVFRYPDAGGQPGPAMDETIANLIAEADGTDFDANAAFKEWQNFGRLRSTSDHFPLVFDV